MNRDLFDQTLALLGKVSSDDAFRLQFQRDPSAALRTLGIEAGTNGFEVPTALALAHLAPKETFAAARKALIEAQRSECLALIIPFQKLTFGDTELRKAA